MKQVYESFGVLTITGIDEPEMLVRLAALAHELNLNIEEAIGHTLADTVVLYAKLSGDEEKLGRMQKAAIAMFQGLTVYSEVRNEPPLPIGPNNEPMSPFPWRINVHSPDMRGLLLELARHLRSKGLKIISYRAEKYAPARSVGYFAAVQTFIVRVPSDFDRVQFVNDLDAFTAKRGYFSVTVEPI